jgi:nucleotide-binding universal stress UspA family protein
MTKPIIVAVDSSREDVAPAALGVVLARLLEAPLVLAAAYPVDLSVDNLYPEYAGALGRAADGAVDRVAGRLAAPDVTVTTTAVQTDGSPARALHQLAREEDAQLLVIGSSERGTVGRAFLSAVTDRLLHGAPCPVAVAPADFSAERLHSIGVAFTDTADGRAALAFAKHIAAAAQAPVRVLSVAEPPDPLAALTIDSLGLDYVRRAHEETAKMAVELGVEELGGSADGDVLRGDPAEALAAASKDLDLLICGARGHGPLKTVLLGGTSHALVRMASCPVLVVPRGTQTDWTAAEGTRGAIAR